MPGRVLPLTATPLSVPDMAEWFVRGHELAIGHKPGSRALLYAALTIIGLENGNGRAIIQHNWGNISAGQYWPGNVWAHPDPQPGQPAYFRAFASHDAGCAEWWWLMYSRYPSVLRQAAASRPRKMVRELYAQGYVAGPDAQRVVYEDTCVKLYREYRRAQLFAPDVPLLSDWVPAVAFVGGVVGAVTIGVLNAR